MMKFKMVLGIAVAAAMFTAGHAYSSANSDAFIADLVSEHALEKAQSMQDALTIERLEAEKAEVVGALYAIENRELQVVERLVTQEVIQYVQTDNATECGISADGVHIHDFAATGVMSEEAESSGRADDSTEGVTNGEFVQVVAENYGDCRSNIAQLAALQSWVAQSYGSSFRG